MTEQQYYPPTTSNLTEANQAVNNLRGTHNLELVEETSNALVHAYRRHEWDEPKGPNPYYDIYARCLALAKEAKERTDFLLIHR